MSLFVKKLPCGDYLVTQEHAKRVCEPWYAPWRWSWEPQRFRSKTGSSTVGWFYYPQGHFVSVFDEPRLAKALKDAVEAFKTRETWGKRDLEGDGA